MMITNKKFIIPSFFIFGILLILYTFGIIEFSMPILICMFVFWGCAIIFDLYTTFQRKELLEKESNPIISYLLEKTTVRKTVILYIVFQVMCVIFLPMICFWKIDFVFSGIFAILVGTIHVLAGISNYNMIRDFDSKKIFHDS